MAFRRCTSELPDPESRELFDDAPGCARFGCDPIYLFACHLEWRDHRNLSAYYELIAALDDPDENIRCLAEALLHRSSPHPNNQLARNDMGNLHPREEHHADRHR
jgi:hypothetical protein